MAKREKEYKDHTLMHCSESILHPLVFYFYSSSSYYPESLLMGDLFLSPGIYGQKVEGKHELSYKSHKTAFCSGGS